MTNQTNKTRDSFIFYRSFFESTLSLNKEQKADLFNAICSYALDGNLIELDGIVKGFFTLIKPQLDANHKKFENGCKGAEYGKLGGRPKNKNPKLTPKKPLKNPKLTPNVNDNVNVNVNHNEECKSKLESQFESFWNLYDKKTSRADAERKFKSALKKESYENIIAGLERYIKSRGIDKKYWKNPSTWLYQECWNDEYELNKQDLPKQETLTLRFNKFMGYEFACKVEEKDNQAIVQLRASHFKLQIDDDPILQNKIKEFFKNKEVKFTW